jgi:hypothetical protein
VNGVFAVVPARRRDLHAAQQRGVRAGCVGVS